MDLADKLLALAAAAHADGGQSLLRTLRGILWEAAPFDAGEAVLRVEGAFVRLRLDEREGELLGDDLLRHVEGLRAPLRLDDLPELDTFPETQRRVAAAGMRSLLVLPLHGAEEQGVVTLARRYGWAFVGASLHVLWPVAGMAAISLRHSLLLTDLRGREEELEAELVRATATPNELKARLEQAIAYGDEREGLRSAANAGWEATRAELKETARRLAAAEAAREAAERERAETEARAAEGDSRLSAEKAAREAAEADAQHRQAEADERLGRAEGQRHALVLEREALRRELDAARAALRDLEEQQGVLRSALNEHEEGLRRAREEAQAASGRGRAEASEARREADEARAATNEARARTEQAQVEADRARVEADDARAEAARGREEARRVAVEIAHLREAADEQGVELRRLEAALAEARGETERAHQESSASRAESERLGERLAAEERARASGRAEVAVLQDENARFVGQLERLRAAAATPHSTGRRPPPVHRPARHRPAPRRAVASPTRHRRRRGKPPRRRPPGR